MSLCVPRALEHIGGMPCMQRYLAAHLALRLVPALCCESDRLTSAPPVCLIVLRMDNDVLKQHVLHGALIPQLQPQMLYSCACIPAALGASVMADAQDNQCSSCQRRHI